MTILHTYQVFAPGSGLRPSLTSVASWPASQRLESCLHIRNSRNLLVVDAYQVAMFIRLGTRAKG